MFCEKGVPKISQNSQENTYARVSFSFGLSSVVANASVADFEHVIACWGRYKIAIVVVRNLEIPYRENKYGLKVRNRDATRRCEIC